MSRTRNPIFPVILSTSLLAMACGDNHDTAARFTDLDNTHLDLVLASMTGGDVDSLYTIGRVVSGASVTDCPTVTTVGSVSTLTGGCVTDDGRKLAGSIVAINLPGIFVSNPTYDPTRPGSVAAYGWSETTAAGEVDSLDGEVTVNNIGGLADNGVAVTGWTDAVDDGIATHSEMNWTCDATDLCAFGDRAWIDIDGVGVATLSGTYRLDPGTGSVDATGAETLTLDVAASTDECQVYKINGGTPQRRCADADPDTKRDRWLLTLGR